MKVHVYGWLRCNRVGRLHCGVDCSCRCGHSHSFKIEEKQTPVDWGRPLLQRLLPGCRALAPSILNSWVCQCTHIACCNTTLNNLVFITYYYMWPIFHVLLPWHCLRKILLWFWLSDNHGHHLTHHHKCILQADFPSWCTPVRIVTATNWAYAMLSVCYAFTFVLGRSCLGLRVHILAT